jgi:hypothetical protein
MSIAPGGVVIVPDSVVGPTAFDIDAKLIVDFDGDGYVDIGTTTLADCHILRGADRVRHGNVALPHWDQDCFALEAHDRAPITVSTRCLECLGELDWNPNLDHADGLSEPDEVAVVGEGDPRFDLTLARFADLCVVYGVWAGGVRPGP